MILVTNKHILETKAKEIEELRDMKESSESLIKQEIKKEEEKEEENKKEGEKEETSGFTKQLKQEEIKKKKIHPIKLLSHQKKLVESIHDDKYPIYVCWGMGSGKTIGACMCMSRLPKKSNVLIICDKSTVIQWQREVERLLFRNWDSFSLLNVNIIHYEFLEQENSPKPGEYAMVIVDEAHRFRNAWAKESSRMLHWMYLIKKCNRVIFLSGTPIVHDAEVERQAFDMMMSTLTKKSLDGRLFFYDPRTDSKSERKYPKVEESDVTCEMSWAQCFKYLLNRRQEFVLHLKGEPDARSRLSSSKNTYNSLLRSIANNPFPEAPSLSPKFQKIMENMKSYEDDSKKQIVYSSRKDTGVKALQSLWNTNSKASFQITGDMTLVDRANNIQKFNRKPNSVLFITDAGAQGIDLKRVDVVHIMEPADNIQDENQIINRAVRYKSHSNCDAKVHVFRYITVFPVTASVAPPWKETLYNSGMFHKDEMKGITRKVQYALRDVIKQEELEMCIDEKVLQIRKQRELNIQQELSKLKQYET